MQENGTATGLTNQNKPNRKKRYINIAIILALWLLSGFILGLFTDGTSKDLHIEISSPRVQIGSLEVSTSVIYAVISTVFLSIVALLIRFIFIPRFKDEPKGLQNVVEIMVEQVQRFSDTRSGYKSDTLGAYIFSLAALMITSELFELLGMRPPTADLIMTLSMALCTFFLVNYYGIKIKGAKGRIKSFAEPIAVVFPIRLLSDIAIPVSLACRLFGNMLGGMIVIHLLYMALGTFSIGIPAVLGLYFNIFHPLMQVFIFITLSLTFIKEAVE